MIFFHANCKLSTVDSKSKDFFFVVHKINNRFLSLEMTSSDSNRSSREDPVAQLSKRK